MVFMRKQAYRNTPNKFSNEDCRSFLDVLSQSDKVIPTEWEMQFIMEREGQTEFDKKEKNIINRMIECYEHRMEQWRVA